MKLINIDNDVNTNPSDTGLIEINVCIKLKTKPLLIAIVINMKPVNVSAEPIPLFVWAVGITALLLLGSIVHISPYM
jgi:hypothetical protein